MKGIVLAGGKASRLYPATLVCSKQLLNVYDKPMIYYPLSILLECNIREILIICNSLNLALFENLFKTGEDLGVKFSYIVQKEARGIADAFILGEKFIGKDEVCLVLGDNFIYGNSLKSTLSEAAKNKEGAVVFGFHVENPHAYGIVEFDENGNVKSIEEKPQNPKSNYAVPGLYFYDNEVVDIAKKIKPSARGELEITTVNEEYLKKGKLKVKLFEKDIEWKDMGTHKDLLKTSNFVYEKQSSGKELIACIEEIAYEKGFINKSTLLKHGENLSKTEYGQHILKFAEGK